MGKLLVVALGGLVLAGCSPYQRVETFQDRDEVKNSYGPHIEEVKIPVSANGSEWGRSVSGDSILRRLGKNPIKGIDESKAEYDVRMSRVDGLTFTSLSYHVFEYDPDTQDVSFSSADPNSLTRAAGSYSEDRNFEDMGSFMAIGMIGGSSVDAGKYVGSNAFGTSVVVSKTKSRGFKVIFGKKGKFQRARMDFDGSCKISPPEYRKHKSDLGVQYIARLIYPYVFKGYSGISPTISMPYDESEDVYYFRVQILAARLIDSKTMQVFPCKIKYSLTSL